VNVGWDRGEEEISKWRRKKGEDEASIANEDYGTKGADAKGTSVGSLGVEVM
jgi:hypothetical protein